MRIPLYESKLLYKLQEKWMERVSMGIRSRVQVERVFAHVVMIVIFLSVGSLIIGMLYIPFLLLRGSLENTLAIFDFIAISSSVLVPIFLNTIVLEPENLEKRRLAKKDFERVFPLLQQKILSVDQQKKTLLKGIKHTVFSFPACLAVLAVCCLLLKGVGFAVIVSTIVKVFVVSASVSMFNLGLMSLGLYFRGRLLVYFGIFIFLAGFFFTVAGGAQFCVDVLSRFYPPLVLVSGATPVSYTHLTLPTTPYV